MISERRCSESIEYLASTDEAAAELKTQQARKEHLLDLSRRKMFLSSQGNIEERKAQAELSKEVGSAMDSYLEAMLEHEKVKAKRLTAALIVETWKTVEVSRRQGHL